MIAWPLVAVISRVRRPIRPRAGIVNSMCVSLAAVVHLHALARRLPTSSITGPTDVAGTSITRYSIGSSRLAVDLLGDDAAACRPTARSPRGACSPAGCPGASRPRPATGTRRPVLVGRTFRATLDSSSFISRSRSCRLVTYLPSWPANGESLTRKIMSSVGSSTVIGGRATGVVEVGDGVADVDVVQPDDGADVAGRDLLGLACGRGGRRRSSCTTVSSTRRPSRLSRATAGPFDLAGDHLADARSGRCARRRNPIAKAAWRGCRARSSPCRAPSARPVHRQNAASLPRPCRAGIVHSRFP